MISTASAASVGPNFSIRLIASSMDKSAITHLKNATFDPVWVGVRVIEQKRTVFVIDFNDTSCPECRFLSRRKKVRLSVLHLRSVSASPAGGATACAFLDHA
jgi:hypothetical protein